MIFSFLKKYWKITKDTFKEFMDDNAISHSASIAFYTIFSLPGILIVVIRIASLAFGEEVVRGRLAERIETVVGREVALEVQRIIENAHLSETSPIMTLVGLSILAFSATTVFTIIQNSLNHIWRVKPKPKSGWLKLIRDRLLSFAMVVTLGFLVLVSLLIDLFIVIFRDFVDYILPGDVSSIVRIVSAGVSLIILTFVFGLVFKVLPDARIQWKDVGVGAIVTTLLFTLGKYLIGIYISASDFSGTYGAAGSIVLILIWVNYSSMILLLGGEFTHVYTRYSGRRILPGSNAVKITLQEIEIEE